MVESEADETVIVVTFVPLWSSLRVVTPALPPPSATNPARVVRSRSAAAASRGWITSPPPIVPSSSGDTTNAVSPHQPKTASNPPRRLIARSNWSNTGFASGSARNLARTAVRAGPTSWLSR